MFTGLVQALGIVLAAAETPTGRRLTVSLSELVDAKIDIGDSICVSGVCLTVVKRANGNVQFDVVTETLRRSTLGNKQPQDRVNLELSLRPDSYLGGHFVQGHVDALALVSAIHDDPADYRLTFRLEPASENALINLIPKGSVAIDGVSMTLAEVNSAAKTFTLAIIPATLEKTSLSALKIGDPVNLETDMLARTVVHWLTNQFADPNANPKKNAASIMISKFLELGRA